MIVSHSSLRQSSIALQNKMRCCTRSELTRLLSEHVFLYFGVTTRPIILIVLLQIDDSSWQCLHGYGIYTAHTIRTQYKWGASGIDLNTFMKKVTSLDSLFINDYFPCTNPRPPAHGANALTTEPPLRLSKCWTCVILMLKTCLAIYEHGRVHSCPRKFSFCDRCFYGYGINSG